MQKASFQGPEESGELFRHGDRKKATARTSCCNIHNATTPATEEPTTSETLASAWVPARAWTLVTVGLTTEETLAMAWMPATSWTRARA
jgi:hypothetical protein